MEDKCNEMQEEHEHKIKYVCCCMQSLYLCIYVTAFILGLLFLIDGYVKAKQNEI